MDPACSREPGGHDPPPHLAQLPAVLRKHVQTLLTIHCPDTTRVNPKIPPTHLSPQAALLCARLLKPGGCATPHASHEPGGCGPPAHLARLPAVLSERMQRLLPFTALITTLESQS